VFVDVYATYQFNTLKNPTGLLGLDQRISTTGSSYITQFHLYISDSSNHVIRDFNGSTGALAIVAGTLGTAGYTNGGLGSAQFNYPVGLSGENMISGAVTGCDHWYYPPYGHCCAACDQPHVTYYNAQEIYVNDSQNFVMRRICKGNAEAATGDCAGQVGQVVTACGSHNYGYVDGPTSYACFASLAGITTSSTGASYIVDAGNHVVRSWDGSNVITVAGSGQPGFVNGPKASAQFMVPGKVTEDSGGNMYVADIGNNAIRKIDAAGNVTTLAGQGPTQMGLVNGPGSSAKLFRPTSIVFNAADGMLYVTDSHNNCIRKIDSNGNVSTYAGNGQAGLVNGSLSESQFSAPADLVIRNGYMYVSDSMNNVIRRIDMVNGVVSTYVS
jgi:hypothetical protein